MTDPETTDPDPATTRPGDDTTAEDAPAFDIDLDPEDQGTAEAGAEPSG